MLSVANKIIMLSVVMLNVVMLSVIVLNVALSSVTLVSLSVCTKDIFHKASMPFCQLTLSLKSLCLLFIS
jgi:hypothetical protein